MKNTNKISHSEWKKNGTKVITVTSEVHKSIKIVAADLGVKLYEATEMLLTSAVEAINKKKAK